MSKQMKPKSGKSRNDDRKNGKAFKNPDAPRNRNSKQSDVQLVLLGKGMLVRHLKQQNAPANQPKRRKSSDD